MSIVLKLKMTRKSLDQKAGRQGGPRGEAGGRGCDGWRERAGVGQARLPQPGSGFDPNYGGKLFRGVLLFDSSLKDQLLPSGAWTEGVEELAGRFIWGVTRRP